MSCGSRPSQPATFDVSHPDSAYAVITQTSRRGQEDLARSEAEQCYRAWSLHKSDLWAWRFRLLYAELLLRNGQTRDAELLLGAAPPGAFESLRVRFDMLQGYVAFRHGRDAEARALLSGAAARAQQLGDFELAADTDLIITVYADPEDAAQTEKLADSVVDLCRRHNLLYEHAAVLANLGLLRIHESRFAAAIPPLQEAAKISRQLGYLLLYSISLGDLATCYYSLGDFDKALDLRLQTIAIQEQAGLRPLLRDSYRELGANQLLAGDSRKAIDSFRRALSLSSIQDTPGVYALIACDLASVLEKSGDLGGAEQYAKGAMAAASASDPEARLSLLLVQAAIANHRGNYAAAAAEYQEVLSASKGYPSIAWAAEASIAEIYADENSKQSRKKAEKHFEAALRTIEASRGEQLQSDYQITFLSGLLHFYQEYVRYLLKQGNIVAALLVANSSRASILTKELSGDRARDNRSLITRLQAEAHHHQTTFLFYFLAPSESYLWIIADQELEVVMLPGEQEIADQVRSYRRLLEVEKLDPISSRSRLPIRLFAMLAGAASKHVARDSTVVVVPDGALHGLSFDTLVVENPAPHYWMEDVRISVAPSLSVLASPGRRKSLPDGQHLIFGDPLQADSNYPRLVNAAYEMEQVQARFGGKTTVVAGRDAVPSAYRTLPLSQFSTIHVAAHGEVNERSPLDSAIILSPQPEGYRLFARDISRVPLRADLVTLSACRSAGARTYSGEGPVGFAWAFFQAGAENVVASLWDVDDRSTAELMSRFYGNVQQGESYRDALIDS